MLLLGVEEVSQFLDSHPEIPPEYNRKMPVDLVKWKVFNERKQRRAREKQQLEEMSMF